MRTLVGFPGRISWFGQAGFHVSRCGSGTSGGLGSKGFTLLEVMIVGAVMALMFVGAWQVYTGGIVSFTSQQVKSDIIKDVRRCLNFFETDFRSARILTGTTNETIVEMTDTKLVFTTFVAGDEDLNHYRTITYEFGSFSDGWGLYRREVDSLDPKKTTFKSLINLRETKTPAGGTVQTGIFPKLTFNGNEYFSRFFGRPSGYNPFLGPDADENAFATDRTLVRSVEMRLVVSDVNEASRMYRTHIFPRAVAIQ